MFSGKSMVWENLNKTSRVLAWDSITSDIDGVSQTETHFSPSADWEPPCRTLTR